MACPAVEAAASTGFQLEDLQRLVSLRDPQISPDGKEIAVIVSTPDVKKNEATKQIDLVDVAHGTRRVLVRNREGLSSPRWSPDGTRLAFLAKDPRTEKTQIFVMPMKGGRTRARD